MAPPLSASAATRQRRHDGTRRCTETTRANGVGPNLRARGGERACRRSAAVNYVKRLCRRQLHLGPFWRLLASLVLLQPPPPGSPSALSRNISLGDVAFLTLGDLPNESAICGTTSKIKQKAGVDEADKFCLLIETKKKETPERNQEGKGAPLFNLAEVVQD